MTFQAGIWALGGFGAKVVESTVWTERRLSVHFMMCSAMKLSLWLQGNQAPIYFEQQHQLNGLKRLPLQSVSSAEQLKAWWLLVTSFLYKNTLPIWKSGWQILRESPLKKNRKSNAICGIAIPQATSRVHETKVFPGILPPKQNRWRLQAVAVHFDTQQDKLSLNYKCKHQNCNIR